MCKTVDMQGLNRGLQKVTHRLQAVYFSDIMAVYTVEIILCKERIIVLCKQNTAETGRKSSKSSRTGRKNDDK